jgi:hypothetical protein
MVGVLGVWFRAKRTGERKTLNHISRNAVTNASKRRVTMTDQNMKNMEMLFQRYIGALSEDFQGKLDLVVEGHQTLHQEIKELSRKNDERFDLVDFKLDTLNKMIDGVEEKLSKKIDGVAADLKAHRCDTEAHHGVYRVRES